MNSYWNHAQQKQNKVPEQQLLVRRDEVWNQDPRHNVDLVGSAHENERGQENINHRVIWDQHKHAWKDI